MCGIIGYVGKHEAEPVLIRGLKRLEYRGYDSAGVAVLGDKLFIRKKPGKIENLEKLLKGQPVSGSIGIGHTRWATHGEPSEKNAHPHTAMSGKIAVVHNGIIENYADLKKELQSRGKVFASDTDTEVVAHLIEDISETEQVPLEEAVRKALGKVVGAYAILAISSDEPDKVVAAKLGSPMVIGLGEEDEHYIASDGAAIVEYTRDVVYLKDNEMAIIPKTGKMVVKTMQNEIAFPEIQTLELSLEALEKKGYAHFMLKEIHEQPQSVQDSMRGRIDPGKGTVKLGGILDFEKKLENAERIIFVSCGTSWHAGLVGDYLFETFARIPAKAEYASEFRYKNPVLGENDVVIAISQSGETADTLSAVKLAKSKGATVLGICNVVGSTLSRETDGGSYTHAGVEIGVASTKAFTAQVSVLAMMALRIGSLKGTLSESRLQELIVELNTIPEKIAAVLEKEGQIQSIAQKYFQATDALFLGRRYGFPVALEGALKLKEISYIHAEGYPAGEMKHGPIALIEEGVPVFAVATKNEHIEKMAANLQEIKARRGSVIAVVTEGDERLKGVSDHLIEIPETEDAFSPLLSVIPLQLLAYHVAVLRGANVDQPRNLAKSVTVE
ncbi:MAG TPA: glutamine--fructose-6-phosphate transaminase (isomerizing) [Candidatus Paceibacterota bacterium]|nr:glutamine--fructose-6-phosphate transaminase (isomerizing) [Candidatus Paceibacterota bacterium]